MITDKSNDVGVIDDPNRLKRRLKGIERKVKLTPLEKAEQIKEGHAKVEEYRQYWDSLSEFRRRYYRTVRYHRGDQWSDLIENEDGELVTEDAYIRSQGKLPLKQNIMRPVAKSLSGLYRSDKSKSVVVSRKKKAADVEEMLSNALQYALHVNESREIDPRTFDLFLLSGLPIQRVGYDYIHDLGRNDIMIEYIDPSYIFFNTDIKDVRLNDLRVIGLIHDITLDEAFVHFAKNSEDKERIKQLFAGVTHDAIIEMYGLEGRERRYLDFHVASEPHKCRVIEVWEKRAVDVIEYWDPEKGEEGYYEEESLEDTIAELESQNAARITKLRALGWSDDEIESSLIQFESAIGYKWFYKYLTAGGDVLSAGESPYDHKSHPFVMYPYPLIAGEVWGPIEDIIDQQRYINRLVTLWDFILGTSAKNTLIVDKNSLDGMSEEELGDSYRQVGGVIALDLQKAKFEKPFELGGKMPNLGITELISMQLKWLQDISGVQPAMQGQSPSSGTPSSRYAQEAQNSAINSKDLMESFASFKRRRDMKVLKTIIQFYKDERYLAISGKHNESALYDPEKVKGIASEFDITITQATDSPAYKSWVDDMLKEFVMEGMIDIEMYLTHSNLPFADSMLEDIKNKKEQIQQGSLDPNAAVSDLSAQFDQQSGVNPDQVKQLMSMIKKDAA